MDEFPTPKRRPLRDTQLSVMITAAAKAALAAYARRHDVSQADVIESYADALVQTGEIDMTET